MSRLVVVGAKVGDIEALDGFDIGKVCFLGGVDQDIPVCPNNPYLGGKIVRKEYAKGLLSALQTPLT